MSANGSDVQEASKIDDLAILLNVEDFLKFYVAFCTFVGNNPLYHCYKRMRLSSDQVGFRWPSPLSARAVLPVGAPSGARMLPLVGVNAFFEKLRQRDTIARGD